MGVLVGLVFLAIIVLFAFSMRGSLEKTVRKVGEEYRSIVKLAFFFCLSTLFLLVIIVMLAFSISSDLGLLTESVEDYYYEDEYEESYESETDEDEDCTIDGEKVESNSEGSRMFGYSNCDE